MCTHMYVCMHLWIHVHIITNTSPTEAGGYNAVNLQEVLSAAPGTLRVQRIVPEVDCLVSQSLPHPAGQVSYQQRSF